MIAQSDFNSGARISPVDNDRSTVTLLQLIKHPSLTRAADRLCQTTLSSSLRHVRFPVASNEDKASPRNLQPGPRLTAPKYALMANRDHLRLFLKAIKQL
jgi:hypothetical protein